MEILRNRYGGYICMILLFMSCWTLPAAAAESDDYQPQETIRVGFFAFNDYHMMDADGHRSGYGYDVLQYMGRYTNWHYEYVGYDKSWEQMQSMLENGEIDMLTLAQPTPEGRLQFDFSSKSIGTSSALLTVRAGDERYTAGDYASYNGMRVGMIRGNNGNDSMAEFAADKGFSYEPVYFDGLEALEQALQDGQLIDAALTSSLHRADNAWVLEQFPERPFYVIVKKGNTRLLDEVDWALTQLDYYSPGWRLDLFGRYAARSNDSDSIPLSRQERDYLESLQQEKHVFKVAMNPDIPPYAYFDDEGNAEGILPELFAEIARRAGIRYEFLPSSSRKEYEQLLASGAADINLTNSTDYHEAEQNQMAMSSYFFDTSLSMVAKKEFSGMPKKLAVPSQYVSRYLHSMEPFKDQQVIIYASAGECIQAVLDGSCDGACLLTYHAQKIVREDVRSQLRTAVLPDTTTGICLGVSANNDYRLLPILNKSIESIHRGAIRQDIVLKYIMNVPEPPFSLERIFYQSPEEAVAIIVLLLLLLLCTGGALNWQFHKAAQRDHARRMELERFLGYVCRANDLVIELDIESGSGRSYRLENGKVHVEPARFSMAEYLAQIHPDDREPIESKLTEENIRKGIREQSSYYFECRVQSEDGSCRWYSHDLLSIPQSKLHPNSFIMFRKDIDGTKRSEEIQHQAICDALETARRASEAKGNFLSRMSHEIRTPLNAIIGYLMLAQQPEASSSKIQHCLANSEFAAKHLLNIINDVLDISAIESGRFKIAREAFNLPQQLTSLTSIFYRQSRDKDIIFSTSMQDIEAEWLLGDPMRIKQILISEADQGPAEIYGPGQEALNDKKTPALKNKAGVFRLSIIFFGKIDFRQRNELGMVLDFVPEVEQENDRNADIGRDNSAPVDIAAGEGSVVLTDDDDRAENQCQIDAEGEAGCTVRQDIKAQSLCFERTAEPVVADRDAEPDNEACHAGELHEPLVGSSVTNQGAQEGQKTECRREQQGIDWHAAFVDLGKAFWRFTRLSHCVEHTR